MGLEPRHRAFHLIVWGDPLAMVLAFPEVDFFQVSWEAVNTPAVVELLLELLSVACQQSLLLKGRQFRIGVVTKIPWWCRGLVGVFLSSSLYPFRCHNLL